MTQLIRSEALRGYPELVQELKGDAHALLAKQGLSGDQFYCSAGRHGHTITV